MSRTILLFSPSNGAAHACERASCVPARKNLAMSIFTKTLKGPIRLVHSAFWAAVVSLHKCANSPKWTSNQRLNKTEKPWKTWEWARWSNLAANFPTGLWVLMVCPTFTIKLSGGQCRMLERSSFTCRFKTSSSVEDAMRKRRHTNFDAIDKAHL